MEIFCNFVLCKQNRIVMLTLKQLRDDKQLAIARLAKKGVDAAPIIDKIIELDDKRKAIQSDLDNCLAEQNKAAKQIGALMAQGKKEEAEEDEKGLHFVATFDDTEEAQRVRGLYKDGRLKKFSFAYDTLEAGPVTLDAGVKANELRELDLFEISCVCVPANDDAGVVDVKSGRRNSAKDENAIREAITLLQGLLEGFEDIEEDPKDSDAKSEEQDPANDEEQNNLEALLKEVDNLINS